ncbi:MAG TPA: sulfite exporter TauE/SafE family protein [Nocardioidaceae bacterium]|nr:sulfite exporter TauE/SafE family protein [Nocardioidaceae bacterium]
MSLLLAVLAGVLIGLSLGALGGGGSILAVPVLVYLLGEPPAQATTGSLVVVGVTSLVSAVAATRNGSARPARGVAFGLVAVVGATVGALASAHVPESVLMASFAALLLVVGGLMAARQLRPARGSRGERGAHAAHGPGGRSGDGAGRSAALDAPIVSLREGFLCDCPRAVKVLVTATGVGLLTGFLGVGGGFLVVPALVVALAMPMELAAGTSLVVITVTSAAALAVRSGVGATPDWGLVAALTAAAVVGGLAGTRISARAGTGRLSAAFTVLVLLVAGYTAVQAVPALL